MANRKADKDDRRSMTLEQWVLAWLISALIGGFAIAAGAAALRADSGAFGVFVISVPLALAVATLWFAVTGALCALIGRDDLWILVAVGFVAPTAVMSFALASLPGPFDATDFAFAVGMGGVGAVSVALATLFARWSSRSRARR